MLENQLNPKPRQSNWQGPRDYTEGASMSPSAMQRMVEAVPDAVMKGIRGDAQKPNPVTGYANPQPTNQVRRGTGWIDERPLESPPGQQHIDRLVTAQDRIDRAERAYALAKAAALTPKEGK
jgi:hypothetical protein